MGAYAVLNHVCNSQRQSVMMHGQATASMQEVRCRARAAACMGPERAPRHQ